MLNVEFWMKHNRKNNFKSAAADECWMNRNRKRDYELIFKFSWEVFIIDVIILIISSMLAKWSLKFLFTNWLFSNKVNQYFVSLASLLAIDIFAIKSFLVCAADASSMFAPIDVPDRSSCLDIINSFCFARSLYRSIISKAKLKDFSFIMFCFKV